MADLFCLHAEQNRKIIAKSRKKTRQNNDEKISGNEKKDFFFQNKEKIREKHRIFQLFFILLKIELKCETYDKTICRALVVSRVHKYHQRRRLLFIEVKKMEENEFSLWKFSFRAFIYIRKEKKRKKN